jgi:hypothetical protein
MCCRHGGSENYWSSGVNRRLWCRSVAKNLPRMVKAQGLVLGNTHTHTHTHTHVKNKFESISTDPYFKGVIFAFWVHIYFH